MNRETTNPYLEFLIGSARLARRAGWRLAWDLNPESRTSRSRLRALKDSRAGKAVIVCNGPSLLREDLSLLAGTFTFGLNKINLLFEKDPFRPSCIVAVNRHVLEQNAPFFRVTDIPLFLDSKGLALVGRRPGVCYLHETGTPSFARDVSMSVFQGYTVTYVALQVAFHLGFRKVGLIGCDHSFAVRGKPNAAVRAGETDASHFDPKYFSGGVTWQLPDLAESEIAYIRAREAFADAGGEIVNCTTGGKLELFRREPLKTFLASG